MGDTYILVLTTVGTRQFANGLARSIVEARLAACVQIQSVQSVYRWKGDIANEPEWLLAIKTVDRLYAVLERHIRANHSYQTPEIVRLPITGGSADYLAWLSASVGDQDPPDAPQAGRS
jgi:periplasmic divalent cation tolerance protein